MKGRTIAGITIGVFQIGLIVLKGAANRHAKKRAMEQALAERSEDQLRLLQNTKERCERFDLVKDREKKDFELRLKEWKNDHRYEARKQEILDSAGAELQDFKEKIGYSGKLESWSEEYDAGLEAFKKTIDYDEAKEKLENAIRDARSKYEKEAKLCSGFDDISDTAMKLKHAAEEAMNSSVEESKQKIKALETQLEAETERLQKIRTEKIKGLEEQLAKEKIRLDKKQSQDLEELGRELDSAKAELHERIRKARSGEEASAMEHHEEDLRLLKDLEQRDERAAGDILKTTPCTAQIAAYLKAKRIPKLVVFMIGGIPVFAVGWLVGEYAWFVAEIIQQM